MLPRIDASKPGCPPVRLDHFGSPRLARDRRTPIITAIVRPIASQAISNTLSSVNHMHSPLRPSTRACLQLVMRSSTNSPAPSRGRRGPINRSAALLVFVHRHGASVAESAVRPGLWRVKGCAAMASPLHVPVVACAPHRRHRPAPVAVVVAGGAARRWDDHPSALGFNQIADEVVRELVAWFGHRDVVLQTSDRPCNAAMRRSRHRVPFRRS